jgi:predicted DNA-binding transcriptional regulator AlpA
VRTLLVEPGLTGKRRRSIKICEVAMPDTIGAAIEAAVARALDAKIPELIRAVSSAVASTKPAPVVKSDEPDRFVKVAEACSLLAMHKTTLLRHEAAGLLPKRRRLPGGQSGYLMSDLTAIMAGAIR